MRVKHFFEYLGVRICLLIVDHASLAAAERVACFVADAWWFASPSRRRISIGNVLLTGITQDRDEAARIARASYRHFGMLAVESLKSGEVFSEENWTDKVETDIHPDTKALLEAPGQPLIVVSGHFGNWEIAAQLVSHMKPIVGIARDLNNPLVDRIVKARQPRNQFTLTPKYHTDITRLMSVLKEGKILGLMIDQHARKGGMMVDFFGVPASTFTSPAMLHLVTKAPIVFGYCIRKGPMQYRMEIPPPIQCKPTGDKEADIRTILEEIHALLEDVIRRYPEQYLWAHRRWRNVKPAPASEDDASS